jgi:hypothetical protein
MGAKPQPHNRFGYGNRRGTFRAWAMAIVFAAVATLSFAVDQTVSLSPGTETQRQVDPPTLLHPIDLIESLIDAASK